MTLFEEALYSESSIIKVIDKYENLLRKSNSNEDLIHAAKLMEYRNIISVKRYAVLRKIFDDFYEVLVKEIPKLTFRIAGRRKSLVSLEQKIQRNLSLNKSLDLIRDLLGVRIILFDENPDFCYKVLELFIKYCLSQGFTICEENLSEDSFASISPLLSQFYYGITDYISKPKENGYQSLHAVFRTSSGLCFEVQIRTLNMHANAALGNSNHSEYKKTKYENLEFDRSKISLEGYRVIDGNIIDFVGFEHSVEILQRNKSF